MSKENLSVSSDFGRKVRILRAALNLSQPAFAKLMGFSRNTVGAVENGTAPSVRFVEQIAMLEKDAPIRALGDSHNEQAERVNPVRAARQAAGLTVRELAKQIDRPIGFLQALEENQGVDVSQRTADALAKALPTLDREAMLRNDENPPVISLMSSTKGTTPDILLPAGMSARYIPKIGMAAAGNLTSFEDIYQSEGHLAIDVKDPKAFAVEISGDSMEPKFSAGDVAIVYPGKEPGNGKLVIGKTKDGDVFFKRLTILSPGHYRFSSYNPTYPPFDRTKDDLEWLYAVAKITVDTM